MIGAEDRDQGRIGLLDEVRVLVDRVRGAPVPRLARRPHLGRHRDDEVVLQEPAELPALGQMLQERLALELGEDVDGVDPGVDEVAEDEVDDAVLAAEGHRGLGALLGQGIETRALSPRQHDSQDAQSHGALRRLPASLSRARHLPPVTSRLTALTTARREAVTMFEWMPTPHRGRPLPTRTST